MPSSRTIAAPDVPPGRRRGRHRGRFHLPALAAPGQLRPLTMIDYDPSRWWSPLLRLHGSTAREIVGRVALCVVWSAAVTAFSLYLHPLEVPATLHSLSGFVLSLLLVFRTNASYDRFWEGRK